MPRSLSMSLRVHHPLGDLLVFANVPDWSQQLVDERGLAVVDVGDDGDVAEGASHRKCLGCAPSVEPPSPLNETPWLGKLALGASSKTHV